MRLSCKSALSSTALLCVLALPSLAHHGWSGQGQEQIEVTGEVHKPVNLVNPHASLQIVADGQVWDVTLAPPSRTESAGLTAKTLAVGDQVTVRGNRNTDPKRYELKAVRVSSGGRNYDLYPERIK